MGGRIKTRFKKQKPQDNFVKKGEVGLLTDLPHKDWGKDTDWEARQWVSRVRSILLSEKEVEAQMTTLRKYSYRWLRRLRELDRLRTELIAMDGVLIA